MHGVSGEAAPARDAVMTLAQDERASMEWQATTRHDTRQVDIPGQAGYNAMRETLDRPPF
ncbi:MAG TPA: hypothetical protein VF812_00990 [Ktedonobacterales bacterium]